MKTNLGFSLIETILVLVFSSLLLLLMYSAYNMAFKKGLKASDKDNVLIRASASLQESMSESLRFTASHLVNVVDYEISSENTPRPDTFIIGFPLRGDCRNEKYVNSIGVSPDPLGYYIQNYADSFINSADKSPEFNESLKSLAWTSYVIYIYYDISKPNLKPIDFSPCKSLEPTSKREGEEFAKPIYELKFYLKQSVLTKSSETSGDFKSTEDETVYQPIYFMERKTAISTGVNALESGSTEINASDSNDKTDDLSDFISEILKNNDALISFRKVCDDVYYFNVSFKLYPAISVNAAFDYGLGGSASSGSIQVNKIKSETYDVSFQILPLSK